MPAYLFGWNPVKHPWPGLAGDAEAVKRGEAFVDSWTCAGYRKVKPGDRAFLVHVGAEPRGLFASGTVCSMPFPSINRKGNPCHRVQIALDVLLNPADTPILTLDVLNMGALAKQNWTPQASGISIRPELVHELELLWEDFLKHGIPLL